MRDRKTRVRVFAALVIASLLIVVAIVFLPSDADDELPSTEIAPVVATADITTSRPSIVAESFPSDPTTLPAHRDPEVPVRDVAMLRLIDDLGQPISGADVDVFDLERETVARRRSDAYGQFGTEHGIDAILIVHPPDALYRIRRVFRSADSADVVVPLSGPTVRIRLLIDGRPAGAGVKLSILHQPTRHLSRRDLPEFAWRSVGISQLTEIFATTAEDGVATLRGIDASFAASIALPGYLSASDRRLLRIDADHHDVTIYASTVASVTGRCIDRTTGRGIREALVSARSRRMPEPVALEPVTLGAVYSNADGNFTMRLNDSPGVLEIDVETAFRGSKSTVVARSTDGLSFDAGTIEFSLDGRADILVVDPSDRPIHGAIAVIPYAKKRFGPSGADGRIPIDGLPRGRVKIDVGARHRLSQLIEVATNVEPPSTRVVLETCASVRLSVVDRLSQPMPRRRIAIRAAQSPFIDGLGEAALSAHETSMGASMSSPGSFETTVTTDALGVVEIPSVKPGIEMTLSLDGKAGGASPAVKVTLGNDEHRDVTIVSDDQLVPRVFGRVFDDKSRPIPGARLELLEDGAETPMTTYTESNGEFSFEAVVAGSVTVDVSAEGFENEKRSVRLIGGTAHQADFDLSPSVPLEVRCVDENGDPVDVDFCEVESRAGLERTRRIGPGIRRADRGGRDGNVRVDIRIGTKSFRRAAQVRDARCMIQIPAIGRAVLSHLVDFPSEIGRVVVAPEGKPAYEIGFLRREIIDESVTIVLEPGTYRLDVEAYVVDGKSGYRWRVIARSLPCVVASGKTTAVAVR